MSNNRTIDCILFRTCGLTFPDWLCTHVYTVSGEPSLCGFPTSLLPELSYMAVLGKKGTPTGQLNS